MAWTAVWLRPRLTEALVRWGRARLTLRPPLWQARGAPRARFAFAGCRSSGSLAGGESNAFAGKQDVAGTAIAKGLSPVQLRQQHGVPPPALGVQLAEVLDHLDLDGVLESEAQAPRESCWRGSTLP